MDEYVEMFKSLGDKTRIRIAYLLAKNNVELCTCEITDSLEVSQYNISRHLKILKNAGLIKERKEGKWVYFSINNDKDLFKINLLKVIIQIPQSVVEKDHEELKKRLKIRVGGKCLKGIQKKQLVS